MNTWEDWIRESGFRLVYQGGHHNLYCDGVKHLRTTGGELQHAVVPNARWPLFKCDCARWKLAK